MRTRNSKRCSTRGEHLRVGRAAMPLPQTRRSSRRWAAGAGRSSSSTRSALLLASWRAFSTASRGRPVTTLTGTRSPMPSTSHQALAATLASTAGAVELQQEVLVFLDRRCPSQGCVDSTAGPPVLKLNSRGAGERAVRAASSRRAPSACSACRAAAARESRTARRGRWPSGRCRRRVPPSQATAIGSGWRRSPNGTTASENLHRDLAHLGDLARGLTLVMVAACADRRSVPTDEQLPGPDVTAAFACPLARVCVAGQVYGRVPGAPAPSTATRAPRRRAGGAAPRCRAAAQSMTETR